MSAVKLIFKIIITLIMLVLIFIAALIIYIQATKPAVPDFEQLKSDYSIIHQADNFEWVPFEELPPTAFSVLLPQETNNVFLNSILLESMSSSVCHIFIPYETLKGRQSNYIFSSHNLAFIITKQLKSFYQLPISPYNPPSSYIQAFHSCTFTTDLLHQWGESRVAEAYLNLSFYGQHTKGIHAASQLYFDKLPYQLNKQETIIIIALLNSPAASSTNPEKLFQSSCRTLTHLPIPEKEKDCDTLKPYLDTFFEYPVRTAQPQENAS